VSGYILIPLVCTHAPFFVNEILSPPDFNGYIAILYISSDQGIHLEDGLTRRGRNT